MWEAELESAFADLGLSGKVQLATGNKPEKARRTGRHMGFGFLEFDGTDVEGLEKAVELLNGVELEGVRVLPSPHPPSPWNRVVVADITLLCSSDATSGRGQCKPSTQCVGRSLTVMSLDRSPTPPRRLDLSSLPGQPHLSVLRLPLYLGPKQQSWFVTPRSAFL